MEKTCSSISVCPNCVRLQSQMEDYRQIAVDLESERTVLLNEIEKLKTIRPGSEAIISGTF